MGKLTMHVPAVGSQREKVTNVMRRREMRGRMIMAFVENLAILYTSVSRENGPARSATHLSH
jgi:hypothetical protein